MGPWADAIVSFAGLLGALLLVFAFRGLIEAMDGFSGRCADCGRLVLMPPPITHPACWRCRHHRAARLATGLHWPVLPHH